MVNMMALYRSLLPLICGSVLGCGADDGETATKPIGDAAAGTGGVTGLGGIPGFDAATGSGGVAGSGAAAGSGGTGGTAGVGAAGGSGGYGGPAACPAKSPVKISVWGSTPWKAPSSGSAQQVIAIPTEKGRHYKKATVTFDVDVTTPPGNFTVVFWLRNSAVPSGYNKLSAYGNSNVKNSVPKELVLTQTGEWNTTKYALKSDTTYKVSYVFDAVAGKATLIWTEPGGAKITTNGTAAGSIVGVGGGLKLFFGSTTSHPEWGAGVRPPWGWTFRNLVVDLEPGGPYGPAAPGCL